MRQRDVAADPIPYHNAHAQLFVAFANESLQFGLSGLDLSAGKLPPTGEFGRLRTGTCEHPTAFNNGGADDDPGGGAIVVHEATDCQIFVNLAPQTEDSSSGPENLTKCEPDLFP